MRAENNFASSLVAESPFVKFAEAQQQFYAQRDRRTLERVLWFAWLGGRFGDAEWSDIKRSVQIVVTPPQIEVRDPEKETAVRKTLHDAGILSRKTWSAQEGLDFEQQQQNLRQEATEAATTDPGSSRKTKLEALIDLLERFWDSSKHPRGAFPQNRGWFSPTWGPGARDRSNSKPELDGAADTGADSRTTNGTDPGAMPNSDAAAASAFVLPRLQIDGERKLDVPFRWGKNGAGALSEGEQLIKLTGKQEVFKDATNHSWKYFEIVKPKADLVLIGNNDPDDALNRAASWPGAVRVSNVQNAADAIKKYAREHPGKKFSVAIAEHGRAGDISIGAGIHSTPGGYIDGTPNTTYEKQILAEAMKGSVSNLYLNIMQRRKQGSRS
jgi:hypothetical protein